MAKLFNFNISYSSLSTFRGCQRCFYYSYIQKLQVPQQLTAYGDAGNVVHKILEKHYNSLLFVAQKEFDSLWEEKKLHSTNVGFHNHLLKKEEYWNAVVNAIKKNYIIYRSEEKIELQDDYLIKGYIDVIAKCKDDYLSSEEKDVISKNHNLYSDEIIVDWKTNSSIDTSHINQMKFYAYLYYRQYKKLPRKFIWEYVKINKHLSYFPTMSDVYEVKNEIQNFIINIHKKTHFYEWTPSTDGVQTNYSQGSCTFCNYKDHCKDADIRQVKEEIFDIEIKRGKFRLLSTVSTKFVNVVDKYFSYEIPNKDFIIRALKKKGRDWDGVVSMKKRGWYPLGLLYKYISLIKIYSKKSNNKILINLYDDRREEKELMEFQDSLNNISLRWYQLAAVDTMQKEKFGIIAVPTAGGKTVIAAEFFRRKPQKTLFVVDRNILLRQTIDEFERVLDISVGNISAGKIDIKSNLTVATIQTIHSRVKKHDKAMLNYLADVDVVISDEAHIAKAEQYSSLFGNAINAHYRFGLTGTPADDAQNALELHKNLGYVIYKIPVQKLIEEGTIMKPTIKFVSYDDEFVMEGDFQDFQEQIIKHSSRNKKILELCQTHTNKVVMILVNRITHGEYLRDELLKLGRDAFFIQGAVDEDTREMILSNARDGHTRVLIGTSSIISKGLNLKTLEVIINATGNATSIQTIQSLGRLLRINENKEHALFYDMNDKLPYFEEHTKQRVIAFETDGHEVIIE